MHAFADEVWRQSQNALINAIISDTKKPVYSLRVELLARARHPKIFGRVSLLIEQRIESEKLQFVWRSSLTAPTESEKDEEVRAEGTPEQMIDAFQKALSAEAARWLTHLPFSDGSGPGIAAGPEPIGASPKMNVALLEISADLVSLAAVPAVPGLTTRCREDIFVLLRAEKPIESEKRQLADFRRGVMTLVEQAVKRSQAMPDDVMRRLPLSLTLKRGGTGPSACFEFARTSGPELSTPEQWRLRRSTPGEDPCEIAVCAELEPMLEKLAELLEQETSEWFSQLGFPAGAVDVPAPSPEQAQSTASIEPAASPRAKEPGLRRRPDCTLLGRALNAIEIKAARSVPLDVIDLPPWLEVKCRQARFQTLLDLATASRRAMLRRSNVHPLEVSRFLFTLDNLVSGGCIADRIGRGEIADLPGNVRRLLAIVGQPYRGILEGTAGLWDGSRVPVKTLGSRLRVTKAWVHQLRDRARRVLARELDRENFPDDLRGLCEQLLAARQGLARVEEWRAPGSDLYRGQEEACLAFVFLCRIRGVKPEDLASLTEDGLCFDQPRTAERFRDAIKKATWTLRRAGRPMHFEELRRHAVITEDDPGGSFLWRALTLSREVQIARDRVVRLRRRRRIASPRPAPELDARRARAPAENVPRMNESRLRP